MNGGAPESLDAAFVSARDWLREFVAGRRVGKLYVGYSGGRDSSVLLTLLGAWREQLPPLTAVHFDHGLQPQAIRWQQHCAAAAAQLDIQFVTLRAATPPRAGASIEAWAREQRYAAFAELLEPGDCLLTAHHRDDQLETVLQHVAQGAGPRGLAGMPRVRRLGRGWLARPLLNCDADLLARFASASRLHFVEDPGNCEQRFLRNRVRRDLLPQMEKAIPGARAGLLRVARVQADVDAAMAALSAPLLAASDKQQCRLGPLRALGGAARRAVLRQWLCQAAQSPPGEDLLRRIDTELIEARADARPVIKWQESTLRRYRDTLYLVRHPLPVTPTAPIAWNLGQALHLPFGTLRCRRGLSPAVDPRSLEGDAVTVCFRRGGEHCRPWPGRHTRRVKTLMQEWGLPPWERGLEPCIYHGEHLVAIGSRCIDRAYAVARGEPGLVFEWRRL